MINSETFNSFIFVTQRKMYKMPEVTNFKKKDNTYCCVPLCNSRGSKNPDLSFHLFPSEKRELARRRKWILALRIGRPVSQRMSVCSRHFLHSDYTLPPHYERKRPRLRFNAIPSLNLPVPDSSEGKPEKRPTTIMIRKESSPVQTDEEKSSEENAEEEDLEIEVNIKSERNYFDIDYDIESEQSYYSTDDNIETERGYYRTDDNIKSEQNYFETEDYIGSQQDDTETEYNSESERDCLETKNDIWYEQSDIKIEDDIEYEREYLNVENYLEIENSVEPELEDLEAGNKIESMTLTTLSKKLI